MERIKNNVRLTGFAGSDPVIVSFSEKKMAKLSIGVHEYYKNSVGETVDQTHWFNLVFWNQKVNLVEDVVKKGAPIRISGKLAAQSFTDKNGEQRYHTEVIVNELEIVDRMDI